MFTAPIASEATLKEIQTLKKKLKTTLNMLEMAFFSEGDLSSDDVDEWIEQCRKEYPELHNP